MPKPSTAVSIFAAVALAFSLSFLAQAEEMGKEVTVKGEVVDTACFLFMGKRGEAHKQCAEACMKAGQDLGVYDEANDTLYFLAGEKPGVNPNKPLEAHIAKTVQVKGMHVHKANAHGLVIKEVKEM